MSHDVQDPNQMQEHDLVSQLYSIRTSPCKCTMDRRCPSCVAADILADFIRDARFFLNSLQ